MDISFMFYVYGAFFKALSAAISKQISTFQYHVGFVVGERAWHS
jgi:hypothetical protein